MAPTAGTSLAPVPQKTVLVVDSSPKVNAMITRVLKDERLEIRRAVDNKTVLSLLKEHPFDLIVTGQKTSGREDIELLHAIRNARPHVRMIIVADESTRADVIEAVRAGAFSYFSPPYTQDGFATMVNLAMMEPAWDDGIEIVSATPSWVRLIVRCDLATADRLVQFLRAGSTLPEPEKNELISAFHEILRNAMEYGGHFDPSQYVEVAFVRARRMVLCRVKDPGQGFSLEEVRHMAAGNSPEDLIHNDSVRQELGMRPGGLGVMMAKRLVDELIYSKQGNDVLLLKYLDPPSSSEGTVRNSA